MIKRRVMVLAGMAGAVALAIGLTVATSVGQLAYFVPSSFYHG